MFNFTFPCARAETNSSQYMLIFGLTLTNRKNLTSSERHSDKEKGKSKGYVPFLPLFYPEKKKFHFNHNFLGSLFKAHGWNLITRN